MITSGGRNGDYLGNLDHPVEGADGDGDVAFLAGRGSCPELRIEAVFIAAKHCPHPAASATSIGLLPSQTALFGDVLDMSVASSLGVNVKVDDRRGSRRDDDMRCRLVLACGSSVIDGCAVVGAVG